jgi:hypothetical protein
VGQPTIWVTADLMSGTCYWMEVEIFSFLGNKCIIPVGQFSDNVNIILKSLNYHIFQYALFSTKNGPKIAVSHIPGGNNENRVNIRTPVNQPPYFHT